MSVHDVIRKGRARLGLSETAFARMCGVSRGSVQHWERDGGNAPSRKHQPAVAKALGISVGELMGGQAEQPPADPAKSTRKLTARDLRVAEMFHDIKDPKQKRIAYAYMVAQSSPDGASGLTNEEDEPQPSPTPKHPAH